MKRVFPMILLVLGTSLAAAFGSRNGERHTAYLEARALVDVLQAAEQDLIGCGDDAAAATEQGEDFDLRACRADILEPLAGSYALPLGGDLGQAIATAEQVRDGVGLPEPRERFSQWASSNGLPFGLGMVLIFIGAVLARRQLAAEAIGGDAATEERLQFRPALTALQERLAKLAADIADLPMDAEADEARQTLDELMNDIIEPIVDNRAALIARHGIGGFAEYFGPFSSGERNLGRTWSALTDGHAVVAREALERARAHFDEAIAVWDAVEERSAA